MIGRGGRPALLGLICLVVTGAAAQGAEICAYADGGELVYDITAGPLRDTPLLWISADGTVRYRDRGEEQSPVPKTAQGRIAAREAGDLLRAGTEALNGMLAEAPLSPAPGFRDTVTSHLYLRFPDCDIAASVEGLALRAETEPENAPLQALRAVEIDLLLLLQAVRP